MAGKKILVAYGTRYGSARIVAGEIKVFLEKSSNTVTLVNLRKDKVPGKLRDYDLVVAGSSVAMFSWISSVKRFLRKCAGDKVPTAVYITCGTDIEDPTKARERFMTKIIERLGLQPILAETISPVIDFRPGEGIPEKTKNRIKSTIKAVAKDKYQENGLMDLRDKERFEKFLENLTELLRTE